MRYLTIAREKSFVACLGKMKVYAEDANNVELVINGVPCRKLGDLKNGEEATFEIGEQAMRIFVIADKISKNYCNEYFYIPEGFDNIRLVGKNKFNPIAGNPFQFYNNEIPEIVENRKKNTRKGFVFLIAVALIAAVFGYLFGYFILHDGAAEPKVFNSNGMSITLTDEFKETQRMIVSFESENVAVFALKEPFTMYEGAENLSLKDYGELVIDVNDKESSVLKNDGDLMYFEYEFYNEELRKNYIYYAYVYKSSDAFWLVNFVTPETKADEYRANISMWADSIEFDS